MRRFQTGTDDGFYACAGGRLDGNEPVLHAMIREAREELGIVLNKEHLTVAHVLHRKHIQGHESMGFFIKASAWVGEPQIMEPHKCDDLKWFTINALPSNTQPHLLHVLDMVNKNIFYSEYGWE